MSEKVSISPLKENLGKLTDYTPELRHIHPSIVNDIGRYLASGLGDSYTPRDFGSALVVLIRSLEEGTQKRNIKSNLIGLHPAVYESLIDLIPQITESICRELPEYESFVEGVKDFYEELLKREAMLFKHSSDTGTDLSTLR